jgi:predicted nucleic acid-binding protein
VDKAVLIVDACTGINVLATGRWAEIFAAGGWQPVMPRQAAAETLFVYEEDGERKPVDLGAMADAGMLEIWEPVDDEVGEMLRHVVRLGAGEAASLAIGRSRGLPLATDDRPARAAAAEEPAVRVISTAELMHTWAKGRPAQDVRAALAAIAGRAAFRPPLSDPLAEWWDEVMSDV